MIKVLFVCLGNVCRSPMAEFVFKDMVKKQGMENSFYISSAGTSSYNEKVREETDYRVIELLKSENIPYEKHISRQIRKEDYNKYDYIIAMEDRHIREIKNIVGSDVKGKVKRLLDYTNNPKDIEDPWYSGDFDKAYYDILHGCTELMRYLKNKENIFSYFFDKN